MIAPIVSASDNRFSAMMPRFSVSNQATFRALIIAFMPPFAVHSANRMLTIPASVSADPGACTMAAIWPAISSTALSGRMRFSRTMLSTMVFSSATQP